MFEVAFGSLHQVGDQIVASFELDIDLGKGVFEPVAQRHQPVVDDHDHDNEEDDSSQQYQPYHN